MTTNRIILVPVDFGDTTDVAIRAAAQFAKATDTKLVTLYADSFLPPVAYADVPVAWYSENVEELKVAAAAKLDDYTRAHVDEDVDIEPRVVADTPVHAILSIASSESIEMIVMGTHGRTGWKRALLGSITESVLHETDVPILTIRHTLHEPAPETPHFRHILCPVNYSDVAREALSRAVVLGDALDAKISVVHVVEAASQDAHERELEELKEWIPGELRHRCCYQELVIRGHAAEAVLDLARSLEADLIVIGAQHKHFVDSTVIGTTTDRIVRHSQCPVLTIIRQAGSVTEHTVQGTPVNHG